MRDDQRTVDVTIIEGGLGKAGVVLRYEGRQDALPAAIV